jgi:hypothetical protein
MSTIAVHLQSGDVTLAKGSLFTISPRASIIAKFCHAYSDVDGRFDGNAPVDRTRPSMDCPADAGSSSLDADVAQFSSETCELKWLPQ